MFQNLLLKNIFSWQILCRDEDTVLMHTIIFSVSIVLSKTLLENT